MGHSADGAAAPIYQRLVRRADETWPHESGQLFGIELELAVHLSPKAIDTACSGIDSGSSLDWSRPAQHIQAVHLGIELPGSRYRQQPDLPFTAALADNLNQAGYILGPKVDSAILQRWHSTRYQILINDLPVYAGGIQHPNGNPLTPVPLCLQQHATLLPGLDSNRFLTTGICVAASPPRALNTFVQRSTGSVSWSSPWADRCTPIPTTRSTALL